MELPSESKVREVLVKKSSETNPSFGTVPENRTVPDLINYGLVNIDKPKGPTSHQISDFVQKILHIDKSGHSGSLDPGVTGVLPVALSRGTRVVHGLLKSGKEYVCIMHLHKDISETELRAAIEKFKGKIVQLPPIKSAVKRVERVREVYYFEILEIDGRDVLFKCGVEAGTYIRKLCDDIGKYLRIGAHMAELRRTKVGPFNEDTLVTLQELTDAYHYWKEEGNEKLIRKAVQPIENAVKLTAKIWVLDSAIESLCHGMNLNVPGISELDSGIIVSDLVAVMSLKGELVGFGEARMTSEQIMHEQKGTAVSMHKVFMQPGTYKTISN